MTLIDGRKPIKAFTVALMILETAIGDVLPAGC